MHSTISISHEFQISADAVWEAMRWDNPDFFADAGVFTRVVFKNEREQWGIIPSSRTVYLTDGSCVDETLTVCEPANMHLRFQLDEPEQYGLTFFEGAYQVEAIGKGQSRLTNSARYSVGSRTQEDFEKAWRSNQAKLFAQIEKAYGLTD